ncbi:hypothetical protein M0R45_030368 [Rubus argutus]|uniref:AN1-type domain-containing protein n=1 Tax=Rubus argutus TaxID=59490 RepID=A0AAW1WD05_RUBAR
MGTPEFPDLGKHCFVVECQQIDFLPFTCDSCHKVFCLEHRSYIKHNCPKGDKQNVTVVICPLCAKGVHLIPDEDPNITWERHVNTDCDPSNYEKATKKKKCPVPGCREILTFSNTIKCRDCMADHCLKHRFGPDHKCPGPKKQEAASSFRASAEAGVAKLSSELSQKWQTAKDGVGQSSNSGSRKRAIGGVSAMCKGFRDAVALVEHVERDHGGTSRA